jgi:tRNA(Ile)-lysidine synthetase-like protein
MSTRIIDFWKSHPHFWIPITPEEKHVADTEITEQFLSYDYTLENVYGQLIYLDQFSRHFQRKLGEWPVDKARDEALAILENNLVALETADEIELVFALMVYKHHQKYNSIFSFLHTQWLQNKKLTDYTHLNKFYMDTYKKAYTFTTVKANICSEHVLTPYTISEICDYYPLDYHSPEWMMRTYVLDSVRNLFPFRKPVIVSLSGGVDSMTMLAILVRLHIPTVAAHIVYGNRQQSKQEYAFIAKYCAKLGVPLYTYSIPWLRRADVDREFYESMTRDLRFMVYKAVAEVSHIDPIVCLGHIQEDVVENIWTNFAKGQHLDNLSKMAREEVQTGVTVCRPFLTLEKSTIYEISTALAIPYLKNTTPSWSNRGKFREHFYAATHAQFGSSVDAKVIEVAQMLTKQSQLIDRLLYRPILNSCVDGAIDITPAIRAEMDEAGWMYIYTQWCHKHLDKTKPSIHAVREFIERLKRYVGGTEKTMKMTMKKDFTVLVTRDGESWKMKNI